MPKALQSRVLQVGKNQMPVTCAKCVGRENPKVPLVPFFLESTNPNLSQPSADTLFFTRRP